MKNDRLVSIERLVTGHGVDLLMLAENTLGIAHVLQALNSQGRPQFHFNRGNCEKIAIYSKFDDRHLKPIHEGPRISVRYLKLSTSKDLILAVAHLQSKFSYSDDSQIIEATAIASDIVRIEERIGHRRTVLIGDLNMNPFESGVVAAGGFHATMDRRIALKGRRKVAGRFYPFFYNPMWNLLGDASPGPPGSCYWQQSENVAFFWNMFDQVLLRPELLPIFQNSDLKILDSDGTISLLKTDGTPDKTVGSDHLPILLRLNF